MPGIIHCQSTLQTVRMRVHADVWVLAQTHLRRIRIASHKLRMRPCSGLQVSFEEV